MAKIKLKSQKTFFLFGKAIILAAYNIIMNYELCASTSLTWHKFQYDTDLEFLFNDRITH